MLGGLLLLWREKTVKKFSLTLVSFAAGSLIGAAFLELIPEAIEEVPTYEAVGMSIIAGIIILFTMEKVLDWYHCHDQETCDYHTFSSTILIGDAFHNFIDGIIIALGFGVGGVAVGIPTAIAVFLHEIPQEMGDFAVLMHAGYSRGMVILYNALTALTAVFGALVGYFLFERVEEYVGIFVALAAGSFIYIAVSDLLPELRHKSGRMDIGHLVALLLGVLIIWAMGVYFPEAGH